MTLWASATAVSSGTSTDPAANWRDAARPHDNAARSSRSVASVSSSLPLASCASESIARWSWIRPSLYGPRNDESPVSANPRWSVERFARIGSILAVTRTAAPASAAACSASARRPSWRAMTWRVVTAQTATTPRLVRTSWPASDLERHQRAAARYALNGFSFIVRNACVTIPQNMSTRSTRRYPRARRGPSTPSAGAWYVSVRLP